MFKTALRGAAWEGKLRQCVSVCEIRTVLWFRVIDIRGVEVLRLYSTAGDDDDDDDDDDDGDDDVDDDDDDDDDADAVGRLVLMQRGQLRAPCPYETLRLP